MYFCSPRYMATWPGKNSRSAGFISLGSMGRMKNCCDVQASPKVQAWALTSLPMGAVVAVTEGPETDPILGVDGVDGEALHELGIPVDEDAVQKIGHGYQPRAVDETLEVCV